MGFDFWSTVRGVRLADTLIKELPKLTKRKKQVIETYWFDENEYYKTIEKLEKRLDEGFRIDHMIKTDDKIIVVYSILL